MIYIRGVLVQKSYQKQAKSIYLKLKNIAQDNLDEKCYKINKKVEARSFGRQGWKQVYLVLRCQFQFERDEKQMPGVSFGLVSRIRKNRFKFCLCIASVSAQVSSKKTGKRSIFWRFCFTTISSSSDGRVSRAIASEVVDLGFIPSSVKPKTRNFVFAVSTFDTQHQRNCTVDDNNDNF